MNALMVASTVSNSVHFTKTSAAHQFLCPAVSSQEKHSDGVACPTQDLLFLTQGWNPVYVSYRGEAGS